MREMIEIVSLTLKWTYNLGRNARGSFFIVRIYYKKLGSSSLFKLLDINWFGFLAFGRLTDCRDESTRDPWRCSPIGEKDRERREESHADKEKISVLFVRREARAGMGVTQTGSCTCTCCSLLPIKILSADPREKGVALARALVTND